VIGQSVTEWEVRSALLHNPTRDVPRTCWLRRTFSSPVTKGDAKHLDFDDTLDDTYKSEGLASLLQWMETFIPPRHQFSNCSLQDFLQESNPWKQQLDEWKKRMYLALKDSLDSIVERKQAWERDGDGLGVAGVQLEEMFHHSLWAATKARSFFGREDLLNDVVEAVMRPARGSYDFKLMDDFLTWFVRCF
jgi:hypothetical protein